MSDVEGDRGGSALRRPAPTEAAAAIADALSRGEAVALVGACAVHPGDGSADEADGPAPPAGHVLVKPDGSVVVHGRAGTTPLHASAGGDVEAAAVGDALQLRTGAGARVEVGRIDLLSRFELDDEADAGGDDVERDAHASLRDRLLAEPDLVEPGFRPLSTERETAAGPVDVYGRDAEGRAVVVEVKARRAGPAAAGQLDRYVAALERDLHADAEVRGTLVAPSATERTRALLAERGYAFRSVSPGGDG